MYAIHINREIKKLILGQWLNACGFFIFKTFEKLLMWIFRLLNNFYVWELIMCVESLGNRKTDPYNGILECY